jgi:hypothetical protein
MLLNKQTQYQSTMKMQNKANILRFQSKIEGCQKNKPKKLTEGKSAEGGQTQIGFCNHEKTKRTQNRNAMAACPQKPSDFLRYRPDYTPIATLFGGSRRSAPAQNKAKYLYFQSKINGCKKTKPF